jgi:ATP phosphoribosyltransferase
MKSLLKLAVQKSGRLSTDSMNLLEDSRFIFPDYSDQLKITASNFPLEVYFLRADDIPRFVSKGVVDIGIVGENTVIERNEPILLHKHLDFGKCRLSIAIPEDQRYEGIQDVYGKRIATSYPNTLSNYLKENKIIADIEMMNGSVELAVEIGISDIICDIVSSGNTLRLNNLKEVEVILNSEALLIGNKFLSEEKQSILEKFIFKIGYKWVYVWGEI